MAPQRRLGGDGRVKTIDFYVLSRGISLKPACNLVETAQRKSQWKNAFNASGVVDVGTACAGRGTDLCPVSDAPHLLQNFAPGRFAVLQDGHDKGSGVPHASQNFAPSRLSIPQLVQSMLYFPYANSSNNAFASLRSAVSKPSVNHP